MAPKIEGRHAAEFLMSEASGKRSRSAITIASGAGILAAGAVLGLLASDGALSVAAAADAGNTGNGVLTLATPAYGAGAVPGVYVVSFIEPGSDAGSFIVEAPSGAVIGSGEVGVAFDGDVKFTIADGATDFAVGDIFRITVSQAAASGEYVASPATGADGSEEAVAVLLYPVDATDAAVSVAAIVRDAEVNGNILTYDDSVDDDAKKAAKIAQLAAVGIIVR